MKMLAIRMENHPIHLLALTYCNYVNALLIPSQELTFLSKPVIQFDFHSMFNIRIYYSCPFPPICFQILPSYHRIQSPIKLESNTFPQHFGIRQQQQPKGPFTQRERNMNKMFGCCPSKLDGEMLPFRFRVWPK